MRIVCAYKPQHDQSKVLEENSGKPQYSGCCSPHWNQKRQGSKDVPFWPRCGAAVGLWRGVLRVRQRRTERLQVTIIFLLAFLALAVVTFAAGALTATTTRAEREQMGVEL